MDLEQVVLTFPDGTSVRVQLHLLEMLMDQKDVDHQFPYVSTTLTVLITSSAIPRPTNVTKNVELLEAVNGNPLDVYLIMIVPLPRNVTLTPANVTTRAQRQMLILNVTVVKMHSVKQRIMKQLVPAHQDTKDIPTKFACQSRNVVLLTTALEILYASIRTFVAVHQITSEKMITASSVQ